MPFLNFSIKEVFLKLLTRHGFARREVIIKDFKSFVEHRGMFFEKLTTETMDGATSMIGKNNCFLTPCDTDETVPKFVAHQCIIHQDAFHTKISTC